MDVLKIFFRFSFGISALGILLLIFDVGYFHNQASKKVIDYIYLVPFLVGGTAIVLRYIFNPSRFKTKALYYDFALLLLLAHAVYSIVMVLLFPSNTQSDDFLIHKLLVLLVFVREFAERKVTFSRAVLNPAQLLFLSYFFMISIGVFLLLLPTSTTNGIAFIDAVFTSTSAVCITGLTSVNVSEVFTTFGQVVLLMLFQIGALGLLTFASYFSYFFKGGVSYESQLMLGDITSSEKIGEVVSILKRILVITLSIELLATLFIYLSLDEQFFEDSWSMLFFSVFHAVSAFCNAGFSTISDGFYQTELRFNYALQIVVLITFLLGSLGFPIVANTIKYLRYKLGTIFHSRKQKNVYKPWVLNLNSRISLITTMALLLIGFVFFYILEYNNTLAEFDAFGKVVNAMFSAATPRSAGFSTIDMTAVSFSSIMLILFLMWVGGAPISTGGGIKTSTFAIATLNILSLAKGKSRIEIFRRELSNNSVMRAFATISLSLIMIGLGIMVLAYLEPEKDIMKITFECFSAYSTVGLSLGITGDLSAAGKIVICVLMLVGRISMLSIVIAVFKKVKQHSYRYPKEEMLIN